MITAAPLGSVATSLVSCTASACRASVRGSMTEQLFTRLQIELNRVRPKYGLPADVYVDGVIGTKTLAKLIKTAQAIDKQLGAKRDSALDDYVYPDIAANLTAQMLAYEADLIVASLQRDGFDPRYVTLDPYAGPTSATAPEVVAPKPNPYVTAPSWALPQRGRAGGVVVVATGPTAPPAQVPALPTLPPALKWTGVAVAGAAGLALAAGVAIRLAKRRR